MHTLTHSHARTHRPASAGRARGRGCEEGGGERGAAGPSPPPPPHARPAPGTLRPPFLPSLRPAARLPPSHPHAPAFKVEPGPPARPPTLRSGSLQLAPTPPLTTPARFLRRRRGVGAGAGAGESGGRGRGRGALGGGRGEGAGWADGRLSAALQPLGAGPRRPRRPAPISTPPRRAPLSGPHLPGICRSLAGWAAELVRRCGNPRATATSVALGFRRRSGGRAPFSPP